MCNYVLAFLHIFLQEKNTPLGIYRLQEGVMFGAKIYTINS